MPDIHNPADVRNPLADLTDYDWLEFVSFAWKVEREGYDYASEEYSPRFETPVMQAVADEPTQLKDFYRANVAAVDTWWDTVGGDTACDLQNAHVDEAWQRREDAMLWGIRCTDGHVITCDTHEYRDSLAGRMRAEAAQPGRREPAALLQRFAPGGDWNESSLPA